MNNSLKKLTEEIKAEMLKSPFFSEKEFVEKTKAAEDSGTFDVIISTSDKDRQGEIVDIGAWDLSNYLNNPIVLWAHDYHQLPIGMADEVKIEGNRLVAKGRFAPMEANPFAQQVRKLYDAGIVKTTSVGFIARQMNGNVITKAELLEFSFVPVPANPYALSLREAKELGIDMAVAKSFNIEIKDVTEAETAPKTDETEEVVETPDTAPEAATVDPVEAPVADAGSDATAQADTPAADSGEISPVSGDEAAQEDDTQVETKAGRVISEKNRQTIQSAIDAMKAAASALEDLMSMTEDSAKGTGGNDQGGGIPEKRSNDLDVAFSKWFSDRKVLRALNNATSKALADFNSKSKIK